MENFLTEQKNVINGGRTRSREASAVQRATLPVRHQMENFSNWMTNEIVFPPVDSSEQRPGSPGWRFASRHFRAVGVG
ncbi:MAG: hypothetical protein LBQ54_12270 [Planctomycetaceae bacterium]|jgi:hypothetical protein|nr:hypothetical protein [Planctomycetaceae bacterium]